MATITKRRGRPTREQAALRVETLFAVAAKIFLSCGYDGTTMEKVALEAGITKPTLYAWYPSKELLFSAVLSHLHRQLPEELFLSELPELPLDAGLRLLARSLIQYALRPECLILHRLM
jgi:AcrR family transcriptional regulator